MTKHYHWPASYEPVLTTTNHLLTTGQALINQFSSAISSNQPLLTVVTIAGRHEKLTLNDLAVASAAAPGIVTSWRQTKQAHALDRSWCLSSTQYQRLVPAFLE